MTRLYNDPSFLYNASDLTYNGAVIFSRTSTGSGTGTSTTPGLHIALRTAIGAGLGTQVASGLHIALRTATGAGLGTSTTTKIVVGIRTATGSGTGTSTTIGVHIGPRTATGAGGASTGDIAIGLHISPRAATGLGIATSTASGGIRYVRTATSLATGTDIPSNWTKTLIFRPPVEDRFPWDSYNSSTPDHRLFAKASQGHRARNVFQLTDLSYTNVDPLDPTLVKTVYWGGHEILVTQEEKTQLVAAGYTVT